MPDPQKQWYSYEELALYFQIGEGLIREYVARGVLPRPVTLGKKMKAWPASELPFLSWILAHNERFGAGDGTEKDA